MTAGLDDSNLHKGHGMNFPGLKGSSNNLINLLLKNQ